MVYIIGTGPGDEELLTIKAVRILKKCTAVLYDRLVSNNILNYLSEDCKVYYCGKEPGSHYKTQEEINEMIVKLAKEGHTVGRIKGGDPFVFGRGGEEILSLIEEDIKFEVIPGVTSPISVLSYAGIPITHRGIAQSFHIITGMSKGVSNIDFSVLAKEEGTLVFMMGLSNLGKIVSNLIENGKSEDTLAAVVMRGTSSKQKKVVGTLKDIEEKVKKAELVSPCIIVVGEVVKFNDIFNWYENKPLFGSNICITRSRQQSARLKENLVELGAEVTEINSIKIEETSSNLDGYINKIEEYDHIILTSKNAVDIFMNYLIKNKIDFRRIKAKFSVIGKATKKALEDKGIIPFLTAREFYMEKLIEDLKSSIHINEKVLVPKSSKSSNLLTDTLEENGLFVDKVDIYDTVCGKLLNNRSFEEVDYIFFTSPSTVENMIGMLGVEKIKEKKCIAIGPKTMRALSENNIEASMCKEHSESGFLNEIIQIINKEVH